MAPRQDDELKSLAAGTSPAPSAAKKAELLTHISNAKFSDEPRTLAEWQRIGVSFVGQPHPSGSGQVLTADTVLTSAEWHVLKHTGQGEWAAGTTAAEYVAAIRTAVLDSSAILDVGQDTVSYPGGQSRLASRTAVRTSMVAANLPKAKRGHGFCMLTIYDPERKRLLSGYQIKTEAALSRVAQWAKHRAF